CFFFTLVFSLSSLSSLSPDVWMYVYMFMQIYVSLYIYICLSIHLYMYTHICESADVRFVTLVLLCERTSTNVFWSVEIYNVPGISTREDSWEVMSATVMINRRNRTSKPTHI